MQMANNFLDRFKNKARTPENFDGPQGSSSMDKDPLRKDTSGSKFHAPRDISKLVDPSHKRTDGFSAKLDNPSDE